jgi:hypothetical protein
MKAMTSGRLAATAGMLALALILGACAGGDGGSRPVSPPVTSGVINPAASDGLLELAPSLANGRHAAFSQYDPAGKSKWSGGEVGSIDLSGVAFDQNQTATLIAPRHVLMATHYQRKVGERIVFHDRSGRPHSALLVAAKSGPNDITVGQLDQSVPVRPYRVLSPRHDYGLLLKGVPVVTTNRQRHVFCHGLSRITESGWVFFGPGPVPGVAGKMVAGDSGNPSFLLVNGEPILIETHTSGGFGGGPFVSDPANFAAINRLIGQMGGGEQLSVLEVR